MRLLCSVYDPATGEYRFNSAYLVEMLIGASIILFGLATVFVEWRRKRRSASIWRGNGSSSGSKACSTSHSASGSTRSYYLGPIAYYQMWLVVASGLYLYAFFKTGVQQTQASVEYLTVQQWYLGGVMRSLHRYGSDGVAATMLLHMARHWCFDRYRGFRWFSWVSGMALVWLVYAAGINGYMLPWDRLSQFVVVATAEWFDRLPIFGGELVRNFIFPEAVNDRLFSLLSFIHIGVPLVVLAVLWVHTQRVPQAKTVPPLPITLTLTAALVALSLFKPALSQGEANLAAAVTTIGFDWFYLPLYALLYRWSPGEVWLLVEA